MQPPVAELPLFMVDGLPCFLYTVQVNHRKGMCTDMLSEKIRQYRKQAGFSQEELAAIAEQSGEKASYQLWYACKMDGVRIAE